MIRYVALVGLLVAVFVAFGRAEPRKTGSTSAVTQSPVQRGNDATAMPLELSANSTMLVADYDPTLGAPRCGQPSAGCDSGTLLAGRDSLGPVGAELHQPNTIRSSCPDGAMGIFHFDESNDRIRVSTLDGGIFVPGKTVRITADVWAYPAFTSDHLDLFYAANAASPAWTYLTTLTPGMGGAQAMSATYVLPPGGLQAVRAVFGFEANASACPAGSHDFTDVDDLIFSVGRSTLEFDVDNDLKTDLALYRPSTGYWYVSLSSTNYTTSAAYQWGTSTDIAVPGDYDGDGVADLAFYRPSTGFWYVLTSTSNYTSYMTQQWGVGTDVPVPGDYDGDGKTDPALYRPSTGFWYILQSSTNYTNYVAYQWGVGIDVPVAGDYDGDGKTDLGLYRPTNGTWYVLLSNPNFTTYFAQQWGNGTDIPVPGDYDGDRKADFSVYRPSTGVWYIVRSGDNYQSYITQQWGLSTDVLVPGDYDGDGKTDLGLYRPSTGFWYILTSISNYTSYFAQQWGASTDTSPLGRH